MIAFLDCFSGISGDMLLGALVDVGLSVQDLRTGLASLPFSGYDISAYRVRRGVVAATKVDVGMTGAQPQRGLTDVLDLIEASSLPQPVKEKSTRVFARLAQAEAAIHDEPVEKVHFHEVGAVDAIVDIVGAAYGLHLLGIDGVYCSPLNVGHGTVRTQHGLLPVPAPATLRLLEGIPVYDSGTEAELVTPTGAAIVTTLCDSFGVIPPMRVTATGYGAGGRDLPTPNVLRIVVGEQESSGEAERVVVLEANIDDMNPELYEHVMDRLFEAGALDVFLVPIHMKKNRPAVLLSVIGHPRLANELAAVILAETSSLGVRFQEMRRTCLPREVVSAQTIYGTIRMKVAHRGSSMTASPEYEDCRKAAREHGVPLRLVYAAAQQAWAATRALPKGYHLGKP